MARKSGDGGKAIGYVRETGPGLESQREAVQHACAQRKLTLVRLHVERLGGASAADVARDAALDEACVNQATLVTPSLSQLAHSLAQCAQIGARLQKSGAPLLVLDDQIDTAAPGGESFFAHLQALANLDRQELAKRVPFGFAVAEDGHHIVVSKFEQAIIRRLVRWHRQGKASQWIADELNRKGILPRRQPRWDTALVEDTIARAPTSRWTFAEET